MLNTTSLSITRGVQPTNVCAEVRCVVIQESSPWSEEVLHKSAQYQIKSRFKFSLCKISRQSTAPPLTSRRRHTASMSARACIKLPRFSSWPCSRRFMTSRRARLSVKHPVTQSGKISERSSSDCGSRLKSLMIVSTDAVISGTPNATAASQHGIANSKR